VRLENGKPKRLHILIPCSCFARPAPERLRRTVLGRPSGSVFASLRRDTRDDLGLLTYAPLTVEEPQLRRNWATVAHSRRE